MPINYDIDWEVRPTGNKLTGSGFNTTNPDAGINYSYNSTYQTFNYNDLTWDINDAPNEQVITTSAGAGNFSAGSYYVGIRYVGLGASNQVLATSQITETLVTTNLNDRIDINNLFITESHPFTHIQLTIRESTGSNAYFVEDTGNTVFALDSNYFINQYSASGTGISVPDIGNVYKLSSNDRPFESNDIGNFILIENNHVGFRSLAGTGMSTTPVTELARTTIDPLAAWFDITDSTKNVKRISMVMWSVGSPSGDLILELRPDNGGVPSNIVLSFGGVAASSLTSTPQWIDINVNVFCTTGRYWIVTYLDGVSDNSNYIRIGRKSGAFGINNQHLFSYNSGTSTWTSVNDGIAVAIDASWSGSDWWTDGNLTTHIENNGNLRFEILNINASNEALVFNPNVFVAELGSFNGVGVLGGADNSIYRVNETAIRQNLSGTINIKGGTYSISNPLTLSNISLRGYDTNHNDYLNTRALLQVDTGSDSTQYEVGSSGMINISADHCTLSSLEIDGQNFAEKLIQIGSSHVFITDCYFHDALNNAIIIDADPIRTIMVDNSYFENISDTTSTPAAILCNSANNIDLMHCFFDSITGTAIYSNGVSFSAQFCVFNNMNGLGAQKGKAIYINSTENAHIHYCTFNDTSSSGVYITGDGHFFITNSIFTNIGDYAIIIDPAYPAAFGLERIDGNGFYNNLGNVVNNNTFSSGLRPFIFSSDPYTDVVNKDFRLNSNFGGGYSLIGAAYPQKFTHTTLPQKLDLGAVQTYGNTPVPRRNPTISYL